MRVDTKQCAKELRKATRLEEKQRLKIARRAARLEQKRQGAALGQHAIVDVNQPMLLITGFGHWGGPLLSRLLDSHPQCFVHPRDLGWDRDGSWPSFEIDSSLGPAHAFDRLQDEWTRRLAADGYRHACFSPTSVGSSGEHVYPFVFSRTLAFEIFARCYRFGEPVTSQRPLLEAYLTALFNAWLDYQDLYIGPKRWVTTLLPSLLSRRDGAQRFFADYPDGRLVAIVRHPESLLMDLVATSHTRIDLEAAVASWCTATRGLLAAAERYRERVIIVRFSDLTLRTEATMRAVCDGVGIRYDAVLQTPTFNSLPLKAMTAALDATRRPRPLDDGLSADVCQAVARPAGPLYEVAERLALAPV